MHTSSEFTVEGQDTSVIEELSRDYLVRCRDRVPPVLVRFGRALEDAGALSDGWPYFLDKPDKWAREYAAWITTGAPGYQETGWSDFLRRLAKLS